MERSQSWIIKEVGSAEKQALVLQNVDSEVGKKDERWYCRVCVSCQPFEREVQTISAAKTKGQRNNYYVGQSHAVLVSYLILLSSDDWLLGKAA